MELDNVVEQSWNVLRIVAVRDEEMEWQVFERTDLGTIIMTPEDYQEDERVLDILLENEFITNEEVSTLVVDGDEHVLQLTDCGSNGRPRFTLVRDRRT